MNLYGSEQYKQFYAQSSDHIIIDCGHTMITIKHGRLFFGKDLRGPSLSEINTVRLALEISQHLMCVGKKVALNFCFSDVGYKMKPANRLQLKTHLLNQYFLNIAPYDYSNLIKDKTGKILFYFNLQSMNSNIASTMVKKIKKQIHCLSLEQMIENFHSLFVIRDTRTFGLLSSHIYDYQLKENEIDYARQLLNQHVVADSRDLLQFPLLNLKRSIFMGLYDKFDGILCPATYMGNLFNMPEKCDVIAIYSRVDDQNIAEKILAGALAFGHLSQKSNLFLSVVYQANMENQEIYLLDKKSSSQKRNEFLNFILKFLAENNNFEVYK